MWRFLTAAVFHMGALHVAFNMLAFVPIGAHLRQLIFARRERAARQGNCLLPWPAHNWTAHSDNAAAKELHLIGCWQGIRAV